MTESYGVFIWSAYAVTAVLVAALVGRAVWDGRAQRRALARLRPEPGRDGGDV